MAATQPAWSNPLIPTFLFANLKASPATGLPLPLYPILSSLILRNYSLPSMSCKIPCHGLYSDVEHEAAGQTIGLDTPGMAQLMKEYQAYKRGNLQDPVPYLKGWHFGTVCNCLNLIQV